MFIMISGFTKFRAVPRSFAIVAFYCRLFLTTAAFLVDDLFFLLFFRFLQNAFKVGNEVEGEGQLARDVGEFNFILSLFVVFRWEDGLLGYVFFTSFDVFLERGFSTAEV